MNAVRRGTKLHQRDLFEAELPIAQLTALTANQSRDPKKQKKPYNMKDFSLYIPVEDRNLASAQYGSAVMQMIKTGIYPSWALFCYKDVVACADDSYIPGVLALVCEDAILVHPEKTPLGVEGMLIAKESASGQTRVMTDEHGNSYTVAIPEIGTKFIAEEGITLPLQ